MNTNTYSITITADNQVTYWAPGARRAESVDLREVNGEVATIARPMGGAPAQVMDVSVYRLSGTF